MPSDGRGRRKKGKKFTVVFLSERRFDRKVSMCGRISALRIKICVEKTLPVSGFEPMTSYTVQRGGKEVVVMRDAPYMVATDHRVRIEELVAVAIALFPNPQGAPNACTSTRVTAHLLG